MHYVCLTKRKTLETEYFPCLCSVFELYSTPRSSGKCMQIDCMCVHVAICTCVYWCVCKAIYLACADAAHWPLWTPTQPQLLIDGKETVCLQKDTHIHRQTWTKTLSVNTIFTLQTILLLTFHFIEKLKSTSWSAHFPVRVKISCLTGNVMQHSASPYRNNSASPSSSVPLRHVPLLQPISWNYHHMAEPPTEQLWDMAIIKGPLAAISTPMGNGADDTVVLRCRGP